jgi:uncharacterized membrane protein HdeD (DUF308 family)
MNSEPSQNVTASIQPAQGLSPAAVELVLRHELHHVRSHWWWFLTLGCLLLVCGTLALSYPIITADFAVRFLSIMLLVAGMATLVGAFWAGKWSGFLVHMLSGILYLAAGFVASEEPRLTIVMVSVYIAITFMVMGIFRILAAMMIRFPQWGWTLLSGCVTFLTGLIIYRHSLMDAPWIIGLLVGLEMLFSGWAWIMLSLEIKRIPA